MIERGGLSVSLNDRLKAVCFTVNDLLIMIERRYISRMEALAVGDTAYAWGEESITIVTAEELLRLDPEVIPQQSKRLLLIKTNQSHCLALVVAEPVEFKELPLDSVYALPKLVAARSTLPCLRAITALDDTIGFIIDPCHR